MVEISRTYELINVIPETHAVTTSELVKTLNDPYWTKQKLSVFLSHLVQTKRVFKTYYMTEIYYQRRI